MSDEDDQPPKNLNAMLEDARAELEASKDQEQYPWRITRERLRELTKIMIRNFAPLDARLDEELSKDRIKQRRAQLAGLTRRSWVAYAADVQVSKEAVDAAAAELEALVPQVIEHDQKLLEWARPLFGRDPKLAAAIDDIARGRGRRDSAEDVLRLAKMYRNDWARVSAMNIISEDALAEAEADASRQLALLEGTASNPTRVLAGLAYSSWYRDYDDLRRAGRYLSKVESEGPKRFPGVRMPTRAPGSAVAANEAPGSGEAPASEEALEAEA